MKPGSKVEISDLNAAEFWHWSLAIYAKPGVREALLTAQDDGAADVNLCLLLAWLDHQRIALTPDAFATMIGVSNILRPELDDHRHRRRQAKGGEQYDALKAAELDLEKQAQSALLSALQRHDAAGTADHADKTSGLGRYLAHLALPDSQRLPILQRLGPTPPSAEYPD